MEEMENVPRLASIGGKPEGDATAQSSPPISLESSIFEAASSDDGDEPSMSTFTLKDGESFADTDMLDYQQYIQITVFLFITSHATFSADTTPSHGYFGRMKTVAEECFLPPTHPFSDLANFLGSVSVFLGTLNLDTFFKERCLWQIVLGGFRDMSAMYMNNRAEAVLRRKPPGGHARAEPGKVWSTYQWHMLREMLYQIRIQEMRGARPKRDVVPIDGVMNMAGWIEREDRREWDFHQSAKREVSRYLAWFSLPIAEKINQLDQALDFLENRLPALQATEEPREATELERVAMGSTGEQCADFFHLTTLRGWIESKAC